MKIKVMLSKLSTQYRDYIEGAIEYAVTQKYGRHGVAALQWINGNTVLVTFNPKMQVRSMETIQAELCPTILEIINHGSPTLRSGGQTLERPLLAPLARSVVFDQGAVPQYSAAPVRKVTVVLPGGTLNFELNDNELGQLYACQDNISPYKRGHVRINFPAVQFSQILAE